MTTTAVVNGSSTDGVSTTSADEPARVAVRGQRSQPFEVSRGNPTPGDLPGRGIYRSNLRLLGTGVGDQRQLTHAAEKDGIGDVILGYRDRLAVIHRHHKVLVPSE